LLMAKSKIVGWGLPHRFKMVGQAPPYLIVLLVTLLGSLCQGKVLEHRWVYVSRSLNRDGDIVDIKSIARTAAESGLNGMVLAAGLDRLDRQNQGYFSRLQQVRRICKDNNIEIIPIIFSVGYGGSPCTSPKTARPASSRIRWRSLQTAASRNTRATA